MDRNAEDWLNAGTLSVALRKESVDRNFEGVLVLRKITMSLSARRAWIEINNINSSVNTADVALRKESVDRNWILFRLRIRPLQVALRKESVDRNECFEWIKKKYPGSLSARRAWIEISHAASCQQRSHRRSPQGERG